MLKDATSIYDDAVSSGLSEPAENIQDCISATKKERAKLGLKARRRDEPVGVNLPWVVAIVD